MVKVFKQTIVFLLACMVTTILVVTGDAYAQDGKEKTVNLTGDAEPIKKIDDKGTPYVDIKGFDIVFDNFTTYSEDTSFTYDDIKDNFSDGESYITGIRFLDMKILNQKSKVDDTDIFEKKMYLTDPEGITTNESNLIFDGNEAYIQSKIVDSGTDFELSLPEGIDNEHGYGWFQFVEMPQEFYKKVDGKEIEYYTNMFIGNVIPGENKKTIQFSKMDREKQGVYICFELDAQKRPVKMVSAFNVCAKSNLKVEAVDTKVLAFLGDSVTLSVKVTSLNDDYDCYWIKKESNGVEKYVEYDETKLVIDKVNMSDFGTYKFKITDGYITKEVIFELIRDSSDVEPVVANLTKVTTQARGTYAIKISWNKAANATGYVVYKAVNGKWLKYAVTAQTSYLYTSLTPGTSYAFAVKPYANYYGKIIYAKTHKSVASFTKPLKPNNIYSIARGYTAIKMGWNKSKGATGYVVYQYVGNKYVRIGTTQSNAVLVKNLRRNTRYNFAVKSYKKVGNQIVYSDGYIVLSTPTKM